MEGEARLVMVSDVSSERNKLKFWRLVGKDVLSDFFYEVAESVGLLIYPKRSKLALGFVMARRMARNASIHRI